MIKYPLLFLSLLLYLPNHSSKCQTSHSYKKDDFDIRQFKHREISLPSVQQAIHFSDIHAMEVIDARADTTEIGFMQKNFKKPEFVLISNGLKNALQQFLKDYCDYSASSSAYDILMVIRKLWLSDELESRRDGFLNQEEPVNHLILQSDSTSGIVLKIEFYAKSNSSYFALYRYDSILRFSLPIYKQGSSYLREGIDSALSRLIEIANKLPVIIARRRAFTLEEIIQHNTQKFDLDILKDSAMRKGVYMTFEEFKNNAPSVRDFEIKKEKLMDMLYIKQPDGTEYGPRNFWGYCDGNHAYVQLFNNFFLLQRKENAFFIYGAKRMTEQNNWEDPAPPPYYLARNPSGLPSPAQVPGRSGISNKDGLLKWNNQRLELKPFQLDWDTGKLY